MIKKVAIGIVALVVILFLVATFYGGSIVKSSVEEYGPEYTKTSVKLADVNFSPLGGSAGLSGLVIGSPAGFDADHTFSLADMSVKLKPRTLFSDTLHINEIRITDPEITVEYKKGKLNIKALMDTLSEYSSDEPMTTEVVIDDLYITGAKVNVMGLPVGEENQEFVLPEIHLQNIGNETGNNEGTTFAKATTTTVEAVSAAVTTILAEQNIRNLIEGGGKSIKDRIKGFLGGGKDDEEEENTEEGGGN